jgi:hypothetical protein
MDLLAPYPLKDLFTIGIPWLCDKIEHHSLYSLLEDGHGNKVDYRAWILWALEQRFVWLYPNPPTLGLIAKPISREMVEHWEQIPEEEFLCMFDRNGDGLWVDFLWAPGQWLTVMRWLRATGKNWVGWQHRTTFRPHILCINPEKDLHHTVDRKSPLLKHLPV